MRKSRFTEAQIIGMIKEHEAGLPTSELCRKHGLSPATFYKLKAKYGGIEGPDDEPFVKNRFISNAQARTLALSAQGFQNQYSSLDQVLETTHVFQLDSVNVFERAHLLPAFSRMGAYSLAEFERWAFAQPQLAEEWAHCATLLAKTDWALFETRLEPMQARAHSFSVLLPISGPGSDIATLQRDMDLVRRVVSLEKPAHTRFDIQPYWTLFRLGQVRLGLDTLLGDGSRDPQLAPAMVLGQGHIGASRTASRRDVPPDRILLEC